MHTSKNWLTLSCISILLGTAHAQPGSVASVLEEAHAAEASGRLQAAADKLEQALAIAPDDQTLFRELSEIYDEKALAYDKAIALHQLYLARFPAGPHSGLFRERQALLMRHKDAWPLLTRYRQEVRDGSKRDWPGKMSALEALLRDATGTSLEPDLLSWLASETAAKDRERALGYVDRYLATFPRNGRSEQERAQGLVQKVTLLRQEGQYGAALATLRGLKAITPAGWEGEERLLVDKVRSALAFQICALFFGLLCATAVASRPWRKPGYAWQGKRMVWLIGGVLVATIGPALILNAQGPQPRRTLLSMAGLGIAALVSIKMLSPIATRVGRPVYLLAAVVLSGTAMYMAHYLGGTLGVWEWPFEAWRS